MQRFYDALDSTATVEDDLRVFRGKTTDVFNSLELPSPYYHKAMALLKKMQCIEQVQRGARHVESIVYLHKRPELSDFLKLDPDEIKNATSERQRVHEITTDARLKNIESNLGGLDIQKLVTDFENRIQLLEAQVSKFTNKSSKTNKEKD